MLAEYGGEHLDRQVGGREEHTGNGLLKLQSPRPSARAAPTKQYLLILSKLDHQ